MPPSRRGTETQERQTEAGSEEGRTQVYRRTDRREGKIDKQTNRQVGRQTGRGVDRQTGRQPERQTEREAERVTDRQKGRHTDRQAGRQAGWQAVRETYTQRGVVSKGMGPHQVSQG